MTEVAINRYRMINGTPALELAARGWLHAADRDLGSKMLNVSVLHSAVMAVGRNGLDAVPAGVITFSHDDERNVVVAHVCFVVEEYRGRGLFRAMWADLVALSMAAGRTRIEFSAHVRNSPMREAFKRLGIVETMVVGWCNLEEPSA